MASTAKLAGLLKTAQTEFRILNRNRNLTAADKKKLKNYYLRNVFAPQAARLLESGKVGRPAAPPSRDYVAGQRLLTAPELEAWLRIDRKTLWGYALQGIIPHIRLQSSVRFPENEIRAWIKRNHHLPRWMRKRPRSRPRPNLRKGK